MSAVMLVRALRKRLGVYGWMSWRWFSVCLPRLGVRIQVRPTDSAEGTRLAREQGRRDGEMTVAILAERQARRSA